jgi:CDP-diacylglycerol--glycerol-3-phosphate 3-phosphatidyltransferase
MNLPNKLTVLRVLMIPFFVVFMITPLAEGNGKYIALALFCIASLTDMLDGKIARKHNLVTNFGKFMDPLFCDDLPDRDRKVAGMDCFDHHCT